MKFQCVCGSGLGSSLLMEMNVKAVLDKLNVQYESVEHTNLNSFSANGVDFAVVGADIAPALDFPKERMVVLQNILSKDELEIKLRELLKIK